MEPRETEFMREMRREGLHNNFIHTISLALSGIVTGLSFALVVIHFAPRHTDRVIAVLMALGATANVITLWFWKKRIRRFKDHIGEIIIMEIKENLER